MLVGVDRIAGIHILPAAVILGREILVSGLREYLAQLQVSMPVTRLAKWKTAIQMVALAFLVIGDASPPLGPIVSTTAGIVGLWAAALLTLVTGYDYLRAGLGHMGGSKSRIGGRPLDRANPARDVG
jgi:cardiolipin synthase